jgi:hypothetical protein
MIRKKINEILDSLPEEELNEVYWSILSVHENYLFTRNLTDKGVLITEKIEEAEDILATWEQTFAKNISEEKKESIYYEQFKWHLFSYEIQDCLKESDAREAFDQVQKDEVYVMYENSPWVFLYKNASKIVAANFDSQQDIYLFDKNLTWTYVHTHESMCGPYFYSLSR